MYAQPGFQTSFLNTRPVESSGVQNKHFLSSSPQPDSFLTSTPIGKDKGRGLGLFSTPLPAGGSESMLTHPGTLDSQRIYSPEGGSGPGGRGTKQKKRGRGTSESGSESDGFHSTSADEDDFSGEGDRNPRSQELEAIMGTSGAPKIVKTTVKQQIVKDAEGTRHDVHEKVEDLTPGGSGLVTLSQTSNQADIHEGETPHIKATKVTTRMATSVEDKEKNATTSQIEEKTFTHTTSTSAKGTEQTVVTQEMRARATVMTTMEENNQKPNRQNGQRRSSDDDSNYSTAESDSGTPIDGFVNGKNKHGHGSRTSSSFLNEAPIVKTESIKYDPSNITQNTQAQATTEVPVVQTESRKVAMHADDGSLVASGEIVSTQTMSSKSRTVETVTYKTEKDGVVETRVEQKITIQSDGDPIDHDKALAEAIQEAAAMNPEMTVEKIEIQQQSNQ
jgi:erythrocyte membrane protein band 4.1